MPNKYPTLVHEWFGEVWNRRDAEAIERLLAADTIVHGITDEHGMEVRGPKAFQEFHSRYINAFPNLTIEVVDTVSEDDKIAARCIVRGKHEGDGIGIKATQKEANFTGICIARVKDGKIVEAWNNFDFLTMHTQLGSLKLLSR